MDQNTRILLRVLDKVERLAKERAAAAKRRADERSALHTRYIAYKAKEEAES